MKDIHKNFHCGGSLINSMWVLTAGHCVSICQDNGWDQAMSPCIDSDPSHIRVQLGRHDRTAVEKYLELEISDIFVHPDYRKIYFHKTTKQFDIALMRLKTEVNFMQYPHIRPVCLPENNNQDYAGMDVTLTGWGITNNNKSSIPTILQEIAGHVLTNKQCADGMADCYGNKIDCSESGVPHHLICTEFPSGKFCNGDSGGPLVTTAAAGHDGVTPGENYVQIGVVSFSKGGCDGVHYGGYARVSEMIGWIEQTVGTGHTDCSKDDVTDIYGVDTNFL